MTPQPSIPADRSVLLEGWSAAVVSAGAPPDHPRIVEVGHDLLVRWTEAHRDYHGITHLVDGLQVLNDLDAQPIEVIAWWLHDAVHHNDPPWDEQKSAALARELLAGLLPHDHVEEMARLVLLTINHDPAANDHAGHRICDADLAMIAADWQRYQGTVASLRAERDDLNDIEWVRLRINTTGRLLNRTTLFHTTRGRTAWEQPARGNLNAERQALFTPEDPTP